MMNEIIDPYRKIVIQIATPYSTGTGFLLPSYSLVLTNEHVVRGNRAVVVLGQSVTKQLARVVYVDPKLDVALLEVNLDKKNDQIQPLNKAEVNVGDPVIAIGHPFGLKFSATSGIVSSTSFGKEDVKYVQHDAALNPGNSGGPLINSGGKIIGINSYIIKDGENIGFSLPIQYIEPALELYRNNKGRSGAKCSSCKNVVYEDEIQNDYCHYCGAKIKLPSSYKDYEPFGVAVKIEEMLTKLDHDPTLSRKGPNAWEVTEGSATIAVAYHEPTGLIFGDAYLCSLPEKNILPIYEFLLKENFKIKGLSFSMKDEDIVLSLLIYDKYLNDETFVNLFRNLFKQADDYDNILIEEYGALPKN